MVLTKELEFHFELARKSGRLPKWQTTANKFKLSKEDVISARNQWKLKNGERVRSVVEVEEEGEKEEPKNKKWSMETLVIKFSSKLQYFGFTVATIVDIALAWFFSASLGSGDLARFILGLMGLVLTAAKTWGWAYSKINRKAIPVAIFALVLSIFGNTAIFRAEIELQAKTTLSTNAEQTSKQSPEEVLQGQISDKQAEIKKKIVARDSINSTVEANLPMYNTLDKKVKDANKELGELNDKLVAIQKAPVVVETQAPKKETIELDAWSVFRQWTEIDWSDHPRTLAYFFTLFFACLPELVIFATTPRKELDSLYTTVRRKE